jgi:hypothetical protein
MEHNVFAPPKTQQQAAPETKVRGVLRVLSILEKSLGGLVLIVVAFALFGLYLEPEELDSDAVLGMAMFGAVGGGLLGCGIALGRGSTWPQYPLLFAFVVLGLLLVIGWNVDY